jgi:hypothetical protein
MITAIFTNYETGKRTEKEFNTRKDIFNYLEENDLLTLDHYEHLDGHMGFVNVYEVTREYGGPEEGGWWFNALRCIESIPCRAENMDTMIQWAKNEYRNIKSGNIYSVLGGSELEVMFEDSPSESETRRKPHWDGEY